MRKVIKCFQNWCEWSYYFAWFDSQERFSSFLEHNTSIWLQLLCSPQFVCLLRVTYCVVALVNLWFVNKWTSSASLTHNPTLKNHRLVNTRKMIALTYHHPNTLQKIAKSILRLTWQSCDHIIYLMMDETVCNLKLWNYDCLPYIDCADG